MTNKEIFWCFEQRAATKVVNEFKDAQKENTNIIRGVDKLTGGLATKIVKLKKGFVSGFGSIKKFITGLSGLKKALLGTGIGALIVGIGLLVANFDKIKQSLFGISKDSKQAAEAAKDSANASEDQLKALNSSDNILRSQGKTEEQIVELKKQQTDETIAAYKIQLEAQKAISKMQTETAKKNNTILTGILNIITVPIDRILKTIKKVASFLGKDFDLNLNGLKESIAGSIFDPETVDEEGQEAIKKIEEK